MGTVHKPYYWVDDPPLLYRHNGSVDPSTQIHQTKSFSNPCWKASIYLPFSQTPTSSIKPLDNFPQSSSKPGGCVNGRMEMHFTFQESVDVKTQNKYKSI